ncbi:Mur ligase family protein, partial [Arthrospira platensis SPKY1]|nr:Mur ligase family protein [Arthrospira platensis SPKY1]
KSDILILDFDDETTVKWLKNHSIEAEILPFSVEKKLTKGAFINDQHMKFKIKEEDFEIELNEVPMPGIHNVKNTMAAVSAAKLLGIRKQSIRESLVGFQGVPHRMELV